MLCSTKVQNTCDLDRKENMLRSVHNVVQQPTMSSSSTSHLNLLQDSQEDSPSQSLLSPGPVGKKGKGTSNSTAGSLSSFVIRTSKSDKEEIDKQIARALYATNTSFICIEQPEVKKAIALLRPGYVPPSRHDVSNRLLTEVYNEEKSKCFKSLSGTSVCLSLDGWSNVHNEPIICATVTTENGKSFLLESIDTSGKPHTTVYLTDLTINLIKSLKMDYNCVVSSIVTDNAANMNAMRNKIQESIEMSVITYGCAAHILNLLCKDLEVQDIKEHVVFVVKYFRNNHFASATYAKEGGKKFVLPNDVRWNSLADCLQVFLEAWPKLLKISEEYKNEIDAIRSKGFFLQPYMSSLQGYANYTNATSKAPVNIPKLPVPKLRDTLDKYLLSVKPFLNVKQFRKTTDLVKDFELGVGSKLQALLEKRAIERDNWLKEWWLAAAYLEYRDPVVVHSSPGLLLPYGALKKRGQLEFAAKMLLGTLEYKAKIDNNQIPQEMMGKHPLDMDQYKEIFGTCRIPWEKRDKLVYNPNSRHIIVLHNDHIFRVDLWGKDNVQLNSAQIVEQLKYVVQNSQLQNEYRVGILTSEQRDNWAKSYQILMKESKNHEYMKDIHESIVALCLDAPCGYLDTEKPDYIRSRGGAQTIHGGGSKSNGGNRWYDKTIQLIVGAEGLAGMSYEHSPADGQPIAVLTNFVFDYIEKHQESAPPSKSPIQPKYLDFKVTPELQKLIQEAANNLDILANNLFLHAFKYKKYGKKFIKSQKLSPDSYLQMAFQYAFYRLHREPGAHYESASTRMYKGGRTETIRSCSMESIAFARSMLDSQATPKQKIEALRKAVAAHKNYTTEALQARGVDRHLLGLKLMALEAGLEVHGLYEDISYKKSTHMRISTSQVAFKSEAFMCYGPLVDDGYATCYNPREENIIFSISTFKDDPDTALFGYKEALEKSLDDMHDLFAKNTPSKL